MKLQDLFPGSFNASHFEDGPALLTIKSIEPVIFREDGEDKQKGKMTFVECSNYWVFGKEASSELGEAMGDETNNWIGHQVELRCDLTEFPRGTLVDCVRGSFPAVNPPQWHPAKLARMNHEPKTLVQAPVVPPADMTPAALSKVQATVAAPGKLSIEQLEQQLEALRQAQIDKEFVG